MGDPGNILILILNSQASCSITSSKVRLALARFVCIVKSLIRVGIYITWLSWLKRDEGVRMKIDDVVRVWEKRRIAICEVERPKVKGVEVTLFFIV